MESHWRGGLTPTCLTSGRKRDSRPKGVSTLRQEERSRRNIRRFQPSKPAGAPSPPPAARAAHGSAHDATTENAPEVHLIKTVCEIAGAAEPPEPAEPRLTKHVQGLSAPTRTTRAPHAPPFLTFSTLRTRLRTFLQMPVSISHSRAVKMGEAASEWLLNSHVEGGNDAAPVGFGTERLADCDRAAVAPPTHYLRILHQQVRL